MVFKSVASLMQIALLVHLNVGLATDWFYGSKDPFGPYPRIPDQELLQKELEFAEECKKFYKAPKEIFIR